MSGLAFAGIVGFSFALGEPSCEVASWPLFDMAFCFPTWSLERKSQIWLQENIEKLIMLNTGRRWFHWSREKTSFGKNVGWLVFDLDLGFQIDSVEQPIRRNSVGSWHVSHGWTSSFDDHLDHSFVVFKNAQLRLALRRMCVGGYIIHIWQSQLFFFCHSGSWLWNCTSHTVPRCRYGWLGQCCWLNVAPQPPCPKDQEQVTHPYVVQHPEKLSQTLWDNARLNLASYISNLRERIFDIRNHMQIPLKSNSSPQGRQQSLSLEINPVDNGEPCYPHDNIVGIHCVCQAWNVWPPKSCQVQAIEDNLWAHLW